MDQGQIIKIAERFATVVKDHFQVKKVVLYGSQIRGNYHDQSDIDIAVIVDDFQGDFLDSEARLFKLRRSVDMRIEPILLDESEDSSGFIHQVLKEGRVIYSPE